MVPEFVRLKLWREGDDKHVYVILDGAQNESLLDVMADHAGLEYECLMTGELEPDMQEVAPYIIHLKEDAAFTSWLMNNGWGQSWGVFVLSSADLGEIWRDLRMHMRVTDPNGRPLYFRFYDPRVMNAFLPTCDAKQLKEFFGRAESFVAELEGGESAHVFSLANGELVTEVVGGI